MKRTIKAGEVCEAWAKHCHGVAPVISVRHPSAEDVHIPDMNAVRVSLSVWPVWDDSLARMSPGDDVMGRFTVKSRIEAWPSPVYQVADNQDSSMYVMKAQLTSSSDQLLQALAISKSCELVGETFLLRLIDAFATPGLARSAIVEEPAAASMRSHICAGVFVGNALLQQLCIATTATLKALVWLHSNGCIHTDLGMDSIVLSPTGCWKVGGLLHVKQCAICGGASDDGVVPRSPQPGRLRPPEVLLGGTASERSVVFDLGVTLVEAATCTPLVPREGSTAPTLFQEIGALHQLLGHIPLKLTEKSPGKQAICVPWGGYLRTLKELSGRNDILEVVEPPDCNPNLSLSKLLASMRRGADTDAAIDVRFSQFRNFVQSLLTLCPEGRCPPKEALNHVFFTNGWEHVEMTPVTGQPIKIECPAKPTAQAEAPIDILPTQSLDEATAALESLLAEGEAALAEETPISKEASQKQIGFQGDAENAEEGWGEKPSINRQQTGFIRAGDATPRTGLVDSQE